MKQKTIKEHVWLHNNSKKKKKKKGKKYTAVPESRGIWYIWVTCLLHMVYILNMLHEIFSSRVEDFQIP